MDDDEGNDDILQMRAYKDDVFVQRKTNEGQEYVTMYHTPTDDVPAKYCRIQADEPIVDVSANKTYFLLAMKRSFEIYRLKDIFNDAVQDDPEAKPNPVLKGTTDYEFYQAVINEQDIVGLALKRDFETVSILKMPIGLNF